MAIRIKHPICTKCGKEIEDAKTKRKTRCKKCNDRHYKEYRFNDYHQRLKKGITNNSFTHIYFLP